MKGSARVLLMLGVISVASAQRLESQTNHRKIAGIYILLGGISGAAGHATHHRSIWKGFIEGAVGGAVVFGSKCEIARASPVTDWAGRTTVGLGTSIVANALMAKPPLQRIAIPVGPMVLERNFKTRHNRARVSLAAAATSTYFFIAPTKTFSLSETLKHDVMAFRDTHANLDYEGGGVIILRHFDAKENITHELTHVSQTDFISQAWGEPLQEWLAPKYPLTSRLNTYFDFNILQPLWAVVSTQGKIWDRPWEKEARYFSYPAHPCRLIT